MAAVHAYIGIGSNLGNPREQVQRASKALAALPQTRLLSLSPWYESDPVGPPGQPDYVNGVALLETQLAPLPLLDALQAIEADHQRVREVRWGPRTLDLDILLYGDKIIDVPRLQVPHPYLSSRGFVVKPLADIQPSLVLPNGTCIESLLRALDISDLRLITGPLTHAD